MKKKKVLLLLVILIVIIIGIAYFSHQHSTVQRAKESKHLAIRKNEHMDQENKVNPNNTQTTGKFSDSEYAPVCWEIAPNTSISKEAKTALFGMALKKQTNSDGSVTVNIKPNSPEYKWNQIIVKQRYKLYFCDYTDDDEEVGMTDTDLNSNGDDFPLLVDPQGNIVPGQHPPDIHNHTND